MDIVVCRVGWCVLLLRIGCAVVVVMVLWLLVFCCGFTVHASGLHCITLCIVVLAVGVVWLDLLVADCCVRFSVLVLLAFVGLYGCCGGCFVCCCLGSLVGFLVWGLCTVVLFSVPARG